MKQEHTIQWLLSGDISIQYQTQRDLLDTELRRLRERMAGEGWGARFLALRRSDGHWGRAYYQPKWTSTHYTLLDLKNLGISPSTKSLQETVRIVLEQEKGSDGGINPSVTIKESDVCLTGMFLNVASYFRADEQPLRPLVDFILAQHIDAQIHRI